MDSEILVAGIEPDSRTRESDVESVRRYVRAANYLTVVQIYLRDNFLLERRLRFEDIKPRLLGHWGTCPGINFIYAHLNNLIRRRGADILFLLGPGHGFPALQANLFLEGTLAKFYPDLSVAEEGIANLASQFSWPFGFPSHTYPGTPGAILEGGELGYALATAYGAVLDNPDLIAACVIGDGEAETGPTAAAWHLNKLVHPAFHGAVLPILHLNGYKISGPSLFGRMDTGELMSLFNGYGYAPILVEGADPYPAMAEALDGALATIRYIQERARQDHSACGYRFPMIILRTPKGWTGIQSLHGRKIEGNYLSHQVVAGQAKVDPAELDALERWLESYRFGELFSLEKGFSPDLLGILPDPGRRMGRNRNVYGGPAVHRPLLLPDPARFAEDASHPGTLGSSSMKRAGLYLNEVFRLNAESRNFILLSPDETFSNKLDSVFETTSRAFAWPQEAWDDHLEPAGRVLEMLSEHCLQGMMQGYVLTGRHAVFASYEAFIQIIASMADQYAKFLKMEREIPWRGPVASLNYILTSSGWRQEHNGFSHQNPGFIDDMLQRQGGFVRVYFPPDGNSTLAVLERCLASERGINVVVAGKTVEPRWLTPDGARQELDEGLMIWDFASDPEPDIIVCGIGDYMTKEALAAIDIVRKETGNIRLRFVNVMEISGQGLGTCRSVEDFQAYFTADRPILFNFHGYPQTLKQILFDLGVSHRVSISGYIENGSTTTPFDMQVRNGTSRYQMALAIFALGMKQGRLDEKEGRALTDKFQSKLSAHLAHIRMHGVDMEEVEAWRWSRSIS